MMVSRFAITMRCSCGRTTELEAVLRAPDGLAPISCGCGAAFQLRQLDAKEVTRIAVDPLGTSEGEIPDDVEPPKIH